MTLLPYRVFGLTVASELPLPNLAPGSGQADVVVQFGAVPERLEDPAGRGVFFEASPGNYLLRIAETARYLVRGGREITIDTIPAADAGRIRTFLLGPVFTALLHQRGALVLHAAGVVGRRGAVLIAGHSGAGKSTLCAEMATRGFDVLCDDAAAIDTDHESQLVVQSGIPQVNLWEDAAARLGVDPGYRIAELPEIDKFAVREPFSFSTTVPRLSAICVLERHHGTEVSAEALPDAERFAAIKEHTRQFRVVNALQTNHLHFRLATLVAQRIPIMRLRRPERGNVQQLADRIMPLLE